MKHFLLLFGWLLPQLLSAAVLHVGPGQTYANLSQAVAVVEPGDTILLHAGTYAGGMYFEGLQGTPAQWITIKNAPGETAIIQGGNNAVQLSDPAYLNLEGLIFQQQTGNGFNTDDGGSYDTPAHHLRFVQCTFRDMAASGNNDLLKLSGLDYFEIRQCTFLNGAAGGSGIDMVGCHHGVIAGNYFENMGSNAIQCKGGTEHIRMEGNWFENAGQRALNLGGSTGLAFFRPDTAHFEAANLQVYSNIFIGSWAPIAYVGSVYVEVVNNTFYKPQNWVVRILQETVDPDRFVECGDNTFINNIIYLGNSISTETNIGPNTRPETFTYANNLWYNFEDANWNGPYTPVPDVNGLVQLNPLFADAAAENFSLAAGSPAIGAGKVVPAPLQDYDGQGFANPPCIGAFEANPVSGVFGAVLPAVGPVFPNPGSSEACVFWNAAAPQRYELYTLSGTLLETGTPVVSPGRACCQWQQTLAPGRYVWVLYTADGRRFAFALFI